MNRSKIVVLDFGSQYAHLIAKRFRALGYYSEIALPSADLSVFEGAKGVVFSGGPSSVYEKDVPEFNSAILDLDLPILGLCYGMAEKSARRKSANSALPSWNFQKSENPHRFSRAFLLKCKFG